MVAGLAQRERPDLRVQAIGGFRLLVEPEPGRGRMVSLLQLYQICSGAPAQRDEAIRLFLATRVYEEPFVAAGDFAANRERLMPQVVPASLLQYCRRDGMELAAVEYPDGLATAFVVDESERYAFVHRTVADRWGVSDQALMVAAIENLTRRSRQEGGCYQVGVGPRAMLVWETFDGYDASRVLLTGDLIRMAARLPGNPVIAIPHRDYLVLFSDVDPAFVAEMSDRIWQHFRGHSYPISPRLYTLRHGALALYGKGEVPQHPVN